MRIFLLDLSFFGFPCVFGNSVFVTMLFRQIFPLLIAFIFSFMYRFFGWNRDKCYNSAGMFVVTFLAATSLGAFQPFSCYTGPNGVRVMISFPHVLSIVVIAFV